MTLPPGPIVGLSLETSSRPSRAGGRCSGPPWWRAERGAGAGAVRKPSVFQGRAREMSSLAPAPAGAKLRPASAVAAIRAARRERRMLLLQRDAMSVRETARHPYAAPL